MTTELPVEASIPSLREALASTGHAVLVAPPGSGKTTVVPLRLAGEPWLADRKIVVLEPRRLATRAAARRMAHLIGEAVGGRVGYVTRDDRRTSSDTRIEVVTEGILTRRLQHDPSLSDTGLVVFDEFHERNLQTDLGLALTLDARAGLRPDLRLLVMSATLDAERVASLLGGDGPPAPVIESEARMHPVEIRWDPPARSTRLDVHAAGVVRRLLDSEEGDLLVFLPGMADIRRVQRLLAHPPVDADVHILHGSVPVAEQDAAIAPSIPGTRKVVLSTDIAETSLTVEGVRVVVDSGLARAPRFDASHGMTRLRTVSVSRSSAEQRSGRAGRLEPGVAVRLWSRLEHGTRRPHVEPEITQVDLAGAALELAAWGVDHPSDLRWLDPPPRRSLEEARGLLRSLGALDGDGRVTPLGEAMAALPLHPRLARMVADAGPDAGLACLLAALVDERDVLRGHPDELPVDLALRVELVSGRADHPAADLGAMQRVERAAADVARRAGHTLEGIEPGRAGTVLALAFPDRLAIRRGSPGRFQLRTGTTAWMPAGDPLAIEPFVVAAELDGRRRDARIRLAAAIDPDQVATRFSAEVDTSAALQWDGERLVLRSERRLGGIRLDVTDSRPEPGPDVVEALLDRVRAGGLGLVGGADRARLLRDRVAFLRRRVSAAWPDWSDEALLGSLDEWLGPHLAGATGLDDLRRLDLAETLRRSLGYPHSAELDRDAPERIRVPSGRLLPIDYSGERPSLAVKVQELFGTDETPRVAGEPVVLHLLSPAGRPVQITDDLGGFWSGTWAEVRKQMAGRYPKHPWPEDPRRARPQVR